MTKHLKLVLANSWTAAAFLAVASFPAIRLSPTRGIDPSWQAGLAMGFAQHFHFGPDILFTYGPLGFLESGALYTTWTAVFGAMYVGLRWFLVCAALVWLARRWFEPIPAMLCALGGAYLALLMTTPELLLLPVTVLALRVVEGGCSARGLRWFAPLAGVGSAFLLLLKLNIGVTTLVISLVLAWFLGRWRSTVAFLGAFACSVPLFWIITGNSLTDLGLWLRGSAEVAGGYSSAMNIEGRFRPLEYVLVLVALAVTGLWVHRMTTPWNSSRRWSFRLIIALALFGMAKHGVRHSYMNLFVLCVVIVACLPPSEAAHRTGRKAMIILVGIVLFAALPYRSLAKLVPVPGPQNLARAAIDLSLPHRRQSISATARSTFQRYYQLDSNTLAELSGHAVHIDPWEISVAWAYDLNWSPLPIFQSYQAYTHGLDLQNARRLAGPEAPERILRSGPFLRKPYWPKGSIDGRNPDFESPEAILTMLCHYTEMSANERWQVLASGPNRCGPPVSLGTAPFHLGEVVDVPPSPLDNSIVVARIRGLLSLPQQVQSALFKGGEYRMTINGGDESYRLLPGTAEGPLLMSAPETLGFAPNFGFGQHIAEFSLSSHRWAPGGDLKVEFFAVPLAPSMWPPDANRS